MSNKNIKQLIVAFYIAIISLTIVSCASLNYDYTKIKDKQKRYYVAAQFFLNRRQTKPLLLVDTLYSIGDFNLGGLVVKEYMSRPVGKPIFIGIYIDNTNWAFNIYSKRDYDRLMKNNCFAIQNSDDAVCFLRFIIYQWSLKDKIPPSGFGLVREEVVGFQEYSSKSFIDNWSLACCHEWMTMVRDTSELMSIVKNYYTCNSAQIDSIKSILPAINSIVQEQKERNYFWKGFVLSVNNESADSTPKRIYNLKLSSAEIQIDASGKHTIIKFEDVVNISDAVKGIYRTPYVWD